MRLLQKQRVTDIFLVSQRTQDFFMINIKSYFYKISVFGKYESILEIPVLR